MRHFRRQTQTSATSSDDDREHDSSGRDRADQRRLRPARRTVGASQVSKCRFARADDRCVADRHRSSRYAGRDRARRDQQQASERRCEEDERGMAVPAECGGEPIGGAVRGGLEHGYARPAGVRARPDCRDCVERVWFPCEGVCPFERSGKPTRPFRASASRIGKFAIAVVQTRVPALVLILLALAAGVVAGLVALALPVAASGRGGGRDRPEGRRIRPGSSAVRRHAREAARPAVGYRARASRSPSSWSPSPASCSGCSRTS